MCLQGYHIGECRTPDVTNSAGSCSYSVDPARAADARWDEASKVAIKVLTKPCPKCRTPTERDGSYYTKFYHFSNDHLVECFVSQSIIAVSGGCMHMICTRAGCGYHWCWVCQVEWSTDCMASHWFG